MYNKKAIERVKLIKKKIEFINKIIEQKGSIELALEDEINSRASILMHLISIAEQFDKLKMVKLKFYPILISKILKEVTIYEIT